MDKPSLLIIDDEPNYLSSIALLLKESFNILTASHGREGLKKFKSNSSLSMILLDLQMPEMDGLETLKAIRALDDKVKVVIMTGNSSHDWAMQCADIGVQGYIQKPFEPGSFVTRMKQLTIKDHNDFFRALWGDDYSLKMALFSPLVRKAIELVDREFSDRIDREKIACSLNVSTTHLSKSFTKECGLQLSAYIIKRRIHESKIFLSEVARENVSDVARKVGISDATYFTKMFKKSTGMTPSEYKNKNKSSIL